MQVDDHPIFDFLTTDDAVVSGLVVLRLNIGRIEARGLAQSMLSTMDATPTWKKMNRELKKMTTAGADLVREGAVIGFSRNARFTSGAKALAVSGVPLRQFANSTFVYQPK